MLQYGKHVPIVSLKIQPLHAETIFRSLGTLKPSLMIVKPAKSPSLEEICQTRCKWASSLQQHNQSPGSSLDKMNNFLASRRWLGIFKIYPEVGLDSANFTGWYPPFPNVADISIFIYQVS
jgi:hypothetical protein